MTTSAEILSDLNFMKMKVFAMFITIELASIILPCLRLGDDRCAGHGQAGLRKPRANFRCQSKNEVVIRFRS